MYLKTFFLAAVLLLSGCRSMPVAKDPMPFTSYVPAQDLLSTAFETGILRFSVSRDQFYGLIPLSVLQVFSPDILAPILENYDCDDIALDALNQLVRLYHGYPAAPAAGLLYVELRDGQGHCVVFAFADSGHIYILDFALHNKGWLSEYFLRGDYVDSQILFF